MFMKRKDVSRAKKRLLSHALEFHVEKLFSHEEFVAVNKYDFPAHATINTVAAAQILQEEAPWLNNDAGVRSGHIGVILEDQVTGSPAQRGFRLVEFELGYNFAVQLNVLELGGERPPLQLGDAPYHRALRGLLVERFIEVLANEAKEFAPQQENIAGDKFPILPLADKGPVLAA